MPVERGRNVPREVLQTFMKERGERCKLIKYIQWLDEVP